VRNPFTAWERQLRYILEKAGTFPLLAQDLEAWGRVTNTL
jgi:hypothetical protein